MPSWAHSSTVKLLAPWSGFRTDSRSLLRYNGIMTGYGQFCSIARAHEVLGARWSLLIVRELLSGGRRFNEIRGGIPRISRTMLSERLRELMLAGVVARIDGPHGPEYELTEAGQELSSLVGVLATWGQRWLPRRAMDEDLDVEPLLIDMQRRVQFDALPQKPFVIRFEIEGGKPRFLLLSRSEASLCTHNPGFPEPLLVKTPLAALVAWWRGDVKFLEAQRMGLTLNGPKGMKRDFAEWFGRYSFAAIAPARDEGRRSTTKEPRGEARSGLAQP
jgi:DNA-binding HxlR family transcriptional regulator